MKKKAKNIASSDFLKLRTEAGDALNAADPNDLKLSDKDVKAIFQELQVHQIELEMQNDELQLINAELEMQRLKFAGIYALAPIGYLILDNLGIIIEANPAGIALLGKSKADILNKKLQQFVAAEYLHTFLKLYIQLTEHPDKHSCQLKLIGKSGKELYAHMEGIYVSATAQYYITIADITESIAARQTLAETKDRLEMAMEASSAGSWELHLNTLTFDFDKFFYRLCDMRKTYSSNSYDAFINLIHPDDRFEADQHFRTAINNSREIDLICRLLKKNNQACYVSIRGHITHKTDHAKSFVGIMWDITEKRLMEEEAALRKEAQQKEITAAVLLAEENERKRISEALHDSVSQLLYGIRLQLSELTVQSNDATLMKLNELLNMAVRETRNISFELAPSILTDFGLPAAIEELGKRISTPHLQIKLHATGLTKRLNADLEINIFRIIQELVNNSIKHADATEINITLKKDKQLHITVADNGKRFDVKRQGTKINGSGFSSIKNRVGLYAGHFTVHSAPGMGTNVTIKLLC